MSVPYYRDISGEIYPRTEVSKHHVFAQSLATNAPTKKFIRQFGLVPMMTDKMHKIYSPTGLHRHAPLLAPPPIRVIDILNNFMKNYSEQRPYDRLIGFVEVVDDLAIVGRDKEVRKECGRMAENLEIQMPFILEGQVQIIPVRDNIPHAISEGWINPSHITGD